MQPRNEYERQVADAARTLRPLTAKQLKWAADRCVTRYGRRTKKGVITCVECGHTWTDKTAQGYCICPACHTRLTIDDDSLRRIYDMADYACFISVHKGLQVLRFVYVAYYVWIGRPARYTISEVVQHWIAPNGQQAVRARLIKNSPFDKMWNYDTLLELRPHKPLYNIHPRYIYPKPELIPELRRNGYDGRFYDLSPSELFCALLRDSRAETLLKAEQITLLQHFVTAACKIDDYWPSIRIVLRNGYPITDVGTWCDYIDLLRFFGKDLRNARYVCPADLRAGHDHYVVKKRKYELALAEEESLHRELEREDEYRRAKGEFFGIAFTDGEISVRVLESIEQIRQEGEAMHHCVFAAEYYKKPDSLILSATMGGKRLETVEVSLARLEVVQSRGRCNQDTPYHNRIVRLVKRNMPLIEKRLTA